MSEQYVPEVEKDLEEMTQEWLFSRQKKSSAELAAYGLEPDDLPILVEY